ncbi:MAG: cyclic nucleotide-binding domain-containing protein [Candidatus Cloacimonetes bacterium]|nr:cyclic nucleotide-binding domain-containing protein [Candidatus Cloacimonadota bacterium]
MSIYRQLNTNPLFKYLNEDELKKIAEIEQSESYKDNDPIFSLGDRNRDIMIIQKGTVAVLIINENGEEVNVASLPEREIIGELNFVIPVRRSANVKAIQNVEICRLPYDKFTELLKSELVVASKIFTAINNSLAEKLMRTINRYIEKNQ